MADTPQPERQNPYPGLPAGGDKDQVLAKTSDLDGDVAWVPGGTGSGSLDLAADYPWTGIHSWARVRDNTDEWQIKGRSKAKPSAEAEKLLSVYRNAAGTPDAVNYYGKDDSNQNLCNVGRAKEIVKPVQDKNDAQDQRLDDLETKETEQDDRLDSLEAKETEQDDRLDALESAPGGGGGGNVPLAFKAAFIQKDGNFQSPQSFDMKHSSGYATGPHYNVVTVNLRLTTDSGLDKRLLSYGLANLPGKPLWWRDGIGRQTSYLIRSVSFEDYMGYNKYSFTVVHDPPAGGDWGGTTSWGWSSFDQPFQIEIPLPDSLVDHEDLDRHDEKIAKTGITFTGAPTPIVWNGYASKGNDLFKFKSSWNNQSPIYFRHHPSNYGEFQWYFGSSTSSFMTWNFGSGDVLKVDRYGIKVNGSSVSRSVDVKDALSRSSNFDEFKAALLAKLEEREREESE